MGDERKLLLSIRERLSPVLTDLLKSLKPFESNDGESIFKFVTGKHDSALILEEEVNVKGPDGKSTPYVFFHFLNSQKIPEDSLKELGKIEEMHKLANRLGISVDDLIYYAFQESNQQMATIACDSNGRIVGVYGIILAQLDDVSMLYRNASVSLPDAPGVYRTHVVTTMQKLPVNVFGASTNEERLPLLWTKLAEEGFGREGEETWVAFPRLDANGNLITLPPFLAQKIEEMRKIPGLNMISGTPPDYERGAIRFAQESGIKRTTENPLYEALGETYGFNPSRGDQILFIAVSPQVLNRLN
jgi:hypothetical protein